MKIIKNGDNRVTKIINKKELNKDTEYRISLFTYFYSENGKYLIQNTLTLEATELTEQEWNAVQQIRNNPVSYVFIAENGIEQLALSRYIVESDYDEIKQYKNVVFILFLSYILWVNICNPANNSSIPSNFRAEPKKHGNNARLLIA